MERVCHAAVAVSIVPNNRRVLSKDATFRTSRVWMDFEESQL